MQGSVTLKLCFLAVTNYFTANAGDIFIITSPPPGVTVGVLDLGVGEVIHEAFLMAKTYDDYQLECGVAYGLRGAVVNNTWTATYSSVYYLVFFQPPDSPSMPNIEFILSKITVSANSLATTLPYSTTVTNPTKIPYATSGISGIMSLLLVAALFLAGVGAARHRQIRRQNRRQRLI